MQAYRPSLRDLRCIAVCDGNFSHVSHSRDARADARVGSTFSGDEGARVSAFQLFVLVAVVGLVLLVGRLVAARDAGGPSGFPYVASPALFTAAERRFLGVLEEAVWPEYRVFGKVRIADVAQPRPGLGRGARQGALNRVSGKHFDFVVCRSSDLAVVCVVELDDRSHGSARTQRRDAFVATVCRVIGLPLLQVPARSGYSAIDVRAQFHAAIAPAAGAPSAATRSVPDRADESSRAA